MRVLAAIGAALPGGAGRGRAPGARVLAATGAVLCTVACSGAGQTEARLFEYRAVGESSLRVAVDGCRTDPVVQQLRETTTEVRLLVLRDVPTGWFGRSDCADAVEVRLAAPLGDRAVVNARSGVAVPGPLG